MISSTIVACLIGCVTALPQSITGQVSLTVEKQNQVLVDDDGRERLFHGTNIVVKAPPYHPEVDFFDVKDSFCDEDMTLVKSMGYNVIRLSVPWAAVEPSQGVYNETYLEIMTALVEKAGNKYGIYSVIEFHQDAWSERFCGNGVPVWAAQPLVDNFPFPLKWNKVPVDPETGSPTKATCDAINGNHWTYYYATYATSSAVGNLYDNFNGLRDSFVQYWKKLATVFGTSPYVIGYELMNEPWAGDIYRNPLMLVPGAADRFKLQPLYDEINTAIREVDQDKLILFEGVTWEVVLPIGEMYGFTSSPGGEKWQSKSVLAFHGSVLPDITPNEKYIGWKKSEMQRLGVGGFMTEAAEDKFPELDAYKISYMHFTYKLFSDLTCDNAGIFDRYEECPHRDIMSDCLRVDQVQLYARTWAKAVAGITTSFTWNADAKVAVLDYVINPASQEPTIIFVSTKWIYEDGFDVIINPSNIATWTFDDDHVVVTHTAPVSSQTLTVTITPKATPGSQPLMTTE